MTVAHVWASNLDLVDRIWEWFLEGAWRVSSGFVQLGSPRDVEAPSSQLLAVCAPQEPHYANDASDALITLRAEENGGKQG